MKIDKKPPAHLSVGAKKLWRDLFEEFVLDDAAGAALLRVAVEAFDRAEEARVRIKRDGAVVLDRFRQLKAHPSCAIERDARGQFMAAIRSLKLEPGG